MQISNTENKGTTDTAPNRLVLVVWAVVILALGIASGRLFSRMGEATHEIASIKDVTIHMLMCRRYEKDFISRRDREDVENHRESYAKLIQATRRLGELGLTASLVADIQAYRTHFDNMVYATEEIGLTEEDGLHGRLRSAIHEVEAQLQVSGELDLQRLMLMCRRYEKDFIIRQDDRSVDKHAVYADSLLKASLDGPNSSLVYTGVFQYRQAFDSLVQKVQDVGVDQESGLRGELRAAIHEVESTLVELDRIAEQDHEDNVLRSTLLIVLVSLLCFVSLGLVIKLARMVRTQ